MPPSTCGSALGLLRLLAFVARQQHLGARALLRGERRVLGAEGARAAACWRECRRPWRPESTTPASAWAPRRPASRPPQPVRRRQQRPAQRRKAPQRAASRSASRAGAPCGAASPPPPCAFPPPPTTRRRAAAATCGAGRRQVVGRPALLAHREARRALRRRRGGAGARCLRRRRSIEDETTLLAGPASFAHVLLRAVVGARALAAGRAALHRLGRAAVRLGCAAGCRGLLVAAVPLWSLAGLLASIDLLLLLDRGAAFLGAARHGLGGAVLHRGDVDSVDTRAPV